MPYKSDAQRKFFHTDTAKKAGITDKEVSEFDTASKGKKLPEHVAKMDEGGEVKPFNGVKESDNGTLAGLRNLLRHAQEGTLGAGSREVSKAEAVDPVVTSSTETPKGYADGGDVSAALGQLAAPFKFLGAPAQMAQGMAANPTVQNSIMNMAGMGSTPPPAPQQPLVDQDFINKLNTGMAMSPPPAQPQSPGMSQVAQSAQNIPATNPSIYQGITAEDRANLMQKLIAQKSSPGMLGAQGVAGLGDAITSSFGKSPTNAVGNIKAAQNQNMEQRTGAMDTQRTQKMQDIQANMMVMKSDPKSSMSAMARQMYKGLTGKTAPSGVSAAQLESVMPLIEKNLEGSVQQAIATGAQGVEAAKTKYGETWGQMFKDVFSPSGETSGEAGLTAAQNKAFPGTGAPSASTSQFKYVGPVK